MFNFQLFPVAYVLMTCKSTDCYLSVFNYIETKLFKLEPHEFMSDYESGMRLAIRKRWPKTTIRGCWFHFCRAILKRCRRLGLSKLIKKNGNARVIQKSIMSLPLLPPYLFIKGYKCIKEFAAKKRLSKQFASVFRYFGYWVNQVTKLF